MNSKNCKSLLVGVDFSEYSKLVVREAKQLSTGLKLPLSFIFAYEDSDVYRDGLKLDKSAIAKSYEDKIRSTYGVEEDQTIYIKFGKPSREILKVAKKMNSPLILVGHKSGHMIERFFLGSVAEQLAATTPFPLWIHRGEKVILPKKILIRSDLSYRSEKTIQGVRKIHKTFKSDVEIFHVVKEPFPVLDYAAWAAVEKALQDEDERRVKQFMKKHPNMKVVKARGGVVESIRSHSKKFDLVAISPRSKEKVKFGQVTGKIVRSGDIPVLVVP